MQDAGVPERTRVVSTGRPPWWLMVVAALVGGAVTLDLFTRGALERMDLKVSEVVSDWGLQDSCGLPAGLGRDPVRRPGDDPRRPRRAGRLPGLDQAHAAAAGAGAGRPRAAHRRGLRDQARHRPDRTRLPGFLLLPRRRGVVPVGARGQRRPHVGRGPVAGGGVRTAGAGAAGVLVAERRRAGRHRAWRWCRWTSTGSPMQSWAPPWGSCSWAWFTHWMQLVLSRWVRARAGRQTA